MQSESEYDTSLPIEEGGSLPDLSSADGFPGDMECLSAIVGGDSNTECLYMLRSRNGRFDRTLTDDGIQTLESELSNVGTDSEGEENYRRVIRRKQIKLMDERLRMRCEWRNCAQAVFEETAENPNQESSLNRFIDHVESHAEELAVSQNDDNEDVYACMWQGCEFETAELIEAKVHVNYHAYHTKLKCLGDNVKIRNEIVDCLYGTGNTNVIPEPLEPLVCYWERCSYNSLNMQRFLYHVNNHILYIGRRVYNFTCQWKGCGNSFKNENKLRCHMRVHTKERVAACPDCGAQFASNTKLLDHCKRQLPVDLQGYQCSHCRKHYPSERILRDHMRSHINRFKCVYCDMTCANRATLATHIRFRHIKFKPYRCRACNYRCETKQDLVTHLQTHDVKDRFECDEVGCEFTCRSNQTMKLHFMKEHEGVAFPYNVYQCHECRKQFSRGSYLTTHLKKKHGLQWPSGHKRFAYRPGEDGIYRLQRIRYESLEVTEEMMANSTAGDDYREDDTFEENVDDPENEKKDLKILLTIDEVSVSGRTVVIECEMPIEKGSVDDRLPEGARILAEGVE